MSRDFTCEACQKNPAHRLGLCGGCGKKVHLCPKCFSSYVACSEKCRAAWRKEAAKGLPKEPLVGHGGGRTRRPKGYSVFQKKLGD